MPRKPNKTKAPSPLRSARTRERLANVVPHPRYGTAIVPSGEVGPDDVIPGPPDGSKDITFPESAIRADMRKHNFTTMSHLHWYVDTLRDCRVCQRPFIFFAREQQCRTRPPHARSTSSWRHCPAQSAPNFAAPALLIEQRQRHVLDAENQEEGA